MSLKCENCGEPALNTDAVCWHCGKALPGREGADKPKVQVKEGWQRGSSSATLPMYIVLTILIILATLVVMNLLGQHPQVQVRFGTRTPANWVQVTSSNSAFVLNLPERWHWLDGSEQVQQSAIEQKLENFNLFNFGTFPLGAEVEDMEIRFLAESEQTDNDSLSFLVVANSALLNRLGYEEAVEFLLNSEYLVSEAVFVDDFDKSHVSILTRTEIDDGVVDLLRCQQQFILGDDESMLVSVCSPAEQYTSNESTFDDILDSFQRLDS